MQRIDGSTVAHALPAPSPVSGTPGYFTEGNPQTATAPTIVTADWLNLVQEELVSIVLAGGLQLSKSNSTQVRDAINALIGTAVTGAINALVAGAPAALNTLKELADAINDDANFAASVTSALGQRALASRQIGISGGLLSGGGALTGDVTLTLLKAAAADIFAGSADDRAATPAALAGAFGTGGGESLKFPGGRILKFGSTGLVDNSGYADVVFAEPFPHACVWGMACNDSGPATNGGAVSWAGIGNFSPTGLRVSMVTASSVPSGPGTASFWAAFGY